MSTARITKGTRKDFLIVVMILIWSLALPFALAENDPGHDTLYIEEQGDSELNGSLNITGNVSIEGGRTALINYLDIYFNGVTVASPSVPTIAGTVNDLYLDAKSGGNVFINAMASSGTVFLGSTGDTVNLNITGALYFVNDRLGVSAGSTEASGDLYWGDKLVCNASVSNCGWVSSVTGGGDITAVYTNDGWLSGGSDTGDVTLVFNESKLNNTIDARAGQGDGNITGAGTSGTLAKFTGDGTIGNSIITESGNVITIAGNISMPSNFYVGSGAKANNSYATAIGNEAKATGDTATAIGSGTLVTGDYAVAVGRDAIATAGQAISVGSIANASNTGSIGIGANTVSSDYATTALGYYSLATNYAATALGGAANATGQYSIALGFESRATAQYATAIGYGVVNDITNSTKLGGMVILSGELNATSHNVSSVSCIVFDSGGKICTGG